MFHEYLKEGTVPLPTEVVKVLSDHCRKMMARSDRDALKEPFDAFLGELDFDKDLSELWVPEYLSVLYGTEFYDRCNDEQKLVLNQMSWVAHYQYSVIGEVMTLTYNNACAFIFRENGHEHIANYLERESDEEKMHIHTFSVIGDTLEARYLGRPMIRQRLNDAYTLHPNGFRDFNGWTATAFYYWLRGHQNISLRAREQALQDVDTKALAPKITAAHFRDETRHYATSHLLAEVMADIDVSLPEPIKLEFITGRSFNGPQAGCNWIWPTVQATPGTLIREAATLLAHPVFKLDRAEVLEVLEAVYTQRPSNPRWEFMRLRTMRNAVALNDRVSWLPEKFKGNLEQTLRYNLDKGVPYARKAFKDYKLELARAEAAS